MIEVSNRVLARQLKKAKIKDFDDLDEQKLKKLLSLVEDAYDNMDSNVYRLERALDISTSELRKFNDNLEERIESEVLKNREKDKKLLSQSRYAAMGEMIGNIAHQWRQPLSAISSTATSMQLQLELELASKDEIYNSFTKIVDFTTFLTQTIEDFRGYLKEDKVFVEFDMIEVFNRTKNIIAGAYCNNGIHIIEKKYSFKSNSLGLTNELSQVFLNILNNAKDAFIEKEIEDRYVYVDFLEENGHNIVKIIDNAGGIPQKIINKIFDPYFTTKHKAQGTGIGLFMSKDIVEKSMNGELSVENVERVIEGREYKGACFTISLPIS